MEQIDLNETNISTANAIKIIQRLDRQKVKALNFSHNPLLGEKFYDSLCHMLMQNDC